VGSRLSLSLSLFLGFKGRKKIMRATGLDVELIAHLREILSSWRLRYSCRRFFRLQRAIKRENGVKLKITSGIKTKVN